MLSFSGQLSALSVRRSTVGIQLSAVGGRRSAFGDQLMADG